MRRNGSVIVYFPPRKFLKNSSKILKTSWRVLKSSSRIVKTSQGFLRILQDFLFWAILGRGNRQLPIVSPRIVFNAQLQLFSMYSNLLTPPPITWYGVVAVVTIVVMVIPSQRRQTLRPFALSLSLSGLHGGVYQCLLVQGQSSVKDECWRGTRLNRRRVERRWGKRAVHCVRQLAVQRWHHKERYRPDCQLRTMQN